MIAPSSPRRPAADRATALALTAVSLLVAACQTAPANRSGFLSSYAGLDETAGEDAKRGRQRDDGLSDAIRRVYIEPSVLRLQQETPLSADEQAMVRNEVDRQICYEVSERFDLTTGPEADAGVIRSAIVRIDHTGRAGSAVSAAASFFIPVPILSFRVPRTTGGLGVEAELLTPEGRQAAALLWSRSADVVGRTDPSLSPVGDALQLAEPLGDAVGDAFSSKSRAVRPIPKPDPCARFGPRRSVGQVAGRVVGMASGLYVPSLSGAGRAGETPEAPAEGPQPR